MQENRRFFTNLLFIIRDRVMKKRQVIIWGSRAQQKIDAISALVNVYIPIRISLN